jgi:prefoldin subunit 5
MKYQVIALLVLALLVSSGCTKEGSLLKSDAYKTYQEQKSDLDAALTEMNKPLQQWADFMGRIQKGEAVYASDLQSIHAEYGIKSDIVKAKVAAVQEFIDDNKSALEGDGVDVARAQNNLNQVLTLIEKNLETMKTEIAKIPQQ